MLEHVGLHTNWVKVIMQFLQGPMGYLVGHTVADERIRPRRGIKQGDTLSPSRFALMTAALVIALRRAVPELQTFMYADDT